MPDEQPEVEPIILSPAEAQLAAWALREVRGWPQTVEGDWDRMVAYALDRKTLSARLERESVGIR